MSDTKQRKYYGGQMQDLFAEALIPQGGTFLDIGSGGPTEDNNTYLLEKKGWKGICVDSLAEEGLPKDLASKYKEER